MKKSITFLFLISFVFSGSVNAQWVYMGFGNEPIHAIAVHPDNADIIFVAGNELYKTVNGGMSWDTVSYNPYNSILFHPLGPDTMYATFGLGTFSDGIYKSVDGGDTWNVLNWYYKATAINVPNYPPGMMLVGSSFSGVEVSYDYGSSWQSMNDSLTNLSVLSLENFIWAGGGPVFLAGTYGGMFRHTTGFWDPVNAAMNIHVPAISIFTQTSSLCWAAFNGGSNSDGMYKSTDFGDTWTVSEYWDFVSDILINPIDSQIVYAADSGMGVKVTTNGGISWNTMNNNLTDSVVFCLAQSISDTFTLYAGTSSGLFKYGLSTGIINNELKNKMNVSVYPNPAYDAVYINIKNATERNYQLQISDCNGRKVFCKSIRKSDSPGIHHLDISKLSRGIYFVTIQQEKRIYTEKFVVF